MMYKVNILVGKQISRLAGQAGHDRLQGSPAARALKIPHCQ